MNATLRDPFRVIVLGAPGAGKTTLASQLAEDLSLAHLSFHRICQLECDNKSDVGIRWRKHSVKNEAFSAGLANRIVQPYLDRSPRFVLDGFPKRNDELEYLRNRYDVIHTVVFLDVPVDKLLPRIRIRRRCPECWASFIPVNNNEESVCPQCGAIGERRQDDLDTEFWKRLADFRQYGSGMFEGLRSFARFARRVSSADEGLDALRQEYVTIASS